MSEEASNLVSSTPPIASPVQKPVQELKLLLSYLITTSKEDKQRYRDDLDDLRSTVTSLTNRTSPPIIHRTGFNRRSSMFFGSPTARDYYTDSKIQIEILQNDIHGASLQTKFKGLANYQLEVQKTFIELSHNSHHHFRHHKPAIIASRFSQST